VGSGFLSLPAPGMASTSIPPVWYRRLPSSLHLPTCGPFSGLPSCCRPQLPWHALATSPARERRLWIWKRQDLCRWAISAVRRQEEAGERWLCDKSGNGTDVEFHGSTRGLAPPTHPSRNARTPSERTTCTVPAQFPPRTTKTTGAGGCHPPSSTPQTFPQSTPRHPVHVTAEAQNCPIPENLQVNIGSIRPFWGLQNFGTSRPSYRGGSAQK